MEFTFIQIIGIFVFLIGGIIFFLGISLSKDSVPQYNSNHNNIPPMTVISRGKNYDQTRIRGTNKESYTDMGAPSFTLSNPMGSLNIINKVSKSFGREDFLNMGNSQELRFVTRKSKGGHFKIIMGIEKDGVNQYYIEDVGSSNGTFLNNIDISNRGKVELRNGDTISPGGTFKVKFKIAE